MRKNENSDFYLINYVKIRVKMAYFVASVPRQDLFCKGESGVPRFFISYSVNIRAELCPSIHFG